MNEILIPLPHPTDADALKEEYHDDIDDLDPPWKGGPAQPKTDLGGTPVSDHLFEDDDDE